MTEQDRVTRSHSRIVDALSRLSVEHNGWCFKRMGNTYFWRCVYDGVTEAKLEAILTKDNKMCIDVRDTGPTRFIDGTSSFSFFVPDLPEVEEDEFLDYNLVMPLEEKHGLPHVHDHEHDD